MTTLHVRKSIGGTLLRLAFLPILIAGFALLPGAQATDLDGVLLNGNTADGSGVLVNLTSGGVWNSGFGFQALNQDTFRLQQYGDGCSGPLQ